MSAAARKVAEVIEKAQPDNLDKIIAALKERWQESFPAPMNKDYGYAIVVLSHGFVYVGDVSLVGEELTIGRALNVREWGTTKGLGQLAVEGPLKGTVLDRCGTIYAPKLALIHIMTVGDAPRKRWEARDELKSHA